MVRKATSRDDDGDARRDDDGDARPDDDGETRRHDHALEERIGSLIVEGQRHEMWVRSEPDDDGTWQNSLLFRRDGKLSPPEALSTRVDWRLPPGIALQRARELDEKEHLELFQQALRPRPPLI